MKTNIAVKVNNFVEAMGVRKIMEEAGYKPANEKWMAWNVITYVRLSMGGSINRVTTNCLSCAELISFDELCYEKRTITLDGKEIEISEESYQEFKKQFK